MSACCVKDDVHLLKQWSHIVTLYNGLSHFLRKRSFWQNVILYIIFKAYFFSNKVQSLKIFFSLICPLEQLRNVKESANLWLHHCSMNITALKGATVGSIRFWTVTFILPSYTQQQWIWKEGIKMWLKCRLSALIHGF